MNPLFRWYLTKRYRFTEKEISMFGLENPEDYKKYLSSGTYRTLRPKLDNKAWGDIVLNKLVSKMYFSYFNLPQPKFYGYLDEIHGYCFEGHPLKGEVDLYDFLQRHKLHQFVIKHVAGGRGLNIHIVVGVSFEKEQVSLIDGQKLGFKDFYNLLKEIDPSHTLVGYLLEELVHLHPKIAAIAMSSPSSLRVVTLKENTGNIIVNMSYVRFGVKGGKTDHSNNGGIYGKVDSNTGRVTYSFFHKHGRPERIHYHPDSQANMDIKIPYWEDAKELACTAAKILPGVNLCGWDVLISEHGPILIEGNAGPRMVGPQVVEGGLFENGIFDEWSTALGVDKPDWSLRWHFNNSKIGQHIKRLVHEK